MADGIIVIDKPSDWTSMDVCAKLRGILKTKKIGHAGTLDPMATGVLPVFVGQATRAVSFAENSRKEYSAVLKLGLVTTTQDIFGDILEEQPVCVTLQDLENVIPQFLGEISQIPPMYSAIKVHGQKLVNLARQGIEIERNARRIQIRSIEILRQISPSEYELRVNCSKGTYIRTLCHDIGAVLGCGGCMGALRRTMAAGFTLENAHSIDEVQQYGTSLLQPVDSLFLDYPAYRITIPRVEALCRNGNPFIIKETGLAPGFYRIYGLDGSFLCLSRLDQNQMTSVKNFFGA